MFISIIGSRNYAASNRQFLLNTNQVSYIVIYDDKVNIMMTGDSQFIKIEDKESIEKILKLFTNNCLQTDQNML